MYVLFFMVDDCKKNQGIVLKQTYTVFIFDIGALNSDKQAHVRMEPSEATTRIVIRQMRCDQQ